MTFAVRDTGIGISEASRSLAFYLRGASQGDDDLYVMVNAHRKALDFIVQERAPAEWRCVIDTAQESPRDILEPGEEARLKSAYYNVGPRSVVVLRRPRRS